MCFVFLLCAGGLYFLSLKLHVIDQCISDDILWTALNCYVRTWAGVALRVIQFLMSLSNWNAVQTHDSITSGQYFTHIIASNLKSWSSNPEPSKPYPKVYILFLMQPKSSQEFTDASFEQGNTHTFHPYFSRWLTNLYLPLLLSLLYVSVIEKEIFHLTRSLHLTPLCSCNFY